MLLFNIMVNVHKIWNTFIFMSLNEILFIRAGIHKMLFRLANREDPDQTDSSEAVWSGSALLSRPFWQATSGRNFRTFTVLMSQTLYQEIS